jgi:hypothetical protein
MQLICMVAVRDWDRLAGDWDQLAGKQAGMVPSTHSRSASKTRESVCPYLHYAPKASHEHCHPASKLARDYRSDRRHEHASNEEGGGEEGQ